MTDFIWRSDTGLVERCFTYADTVGLLGTGAQDGHLDFHTAPELSYGEAAVPVCWTVSAKRHAVERRSKDDGAGHNVLRCRADTRRTKWEHSFSLGSLCEGVKRGMSQLETQQTGP